MKSIARTRKVASVDEQMAQVAAAIAEPARARMLCALMDGRARTATELAAAADIAASTASSHLAKLSSNGLVECLAQGRYRYFRLASSDAAAAVEALLAVAGTQRPSFVPNTPPRLRQARTCYDHAAGEVPVAVHDRLFALRWLRRAEQDYALTPSGADAFEKLGVPVQSAQQRRRKFACACLDWSERRVHLGGALGAALLNVFLERAWFERELDGRALVLTDKGRQALANEFGVNVPAQRLERESA